MNFNFVPMTDDQARVVAGWKYEGIYAFYDWEADADDLAELLDPVKRARDRTHAVLGDDDSLVGFFGFTLDGSTVEVGFGLRPDLTGRGLGLSFVNAGLEFAREHYAPSTFRLMVAAFNQRAITVYERAGFQGQRTFRHRTNGGEFDFVEMSRPA
ncbi:MAG: GNAT family protein [Dehalococcoidia bacterium]|nr:GNAT family protein [Dehalococcoidia bacterium]